MIVWDDDLNRREKVLHKQTMSRSTTNTIDNTVKNNIDIQPALSRIQQTEDNKRDIERIRESIWDVYKKTSIRPI